MKKYLLSPWLALITLSLFALIKFSDPYLVQSMRLKYYDYLMLSSPQKSEEIVLLNVGETAISTYGQWPWPRSIHGKIIEDAYAHGAALVGTTVMFSEQERSGNPFKEVPFENYLKNYPVVLSQTVSDDCPPKPSEVKPTGIAVIGDGEAHQFLPVYQCVISNLPELQKSSAGVGITATLPESDGVVRRVPLLSQSAGEYYPAFAVELLRVLAGDQSYQAKINLSGVEALRVPSFETIKTDEVGRIFINPNYIFDQYEIGKELPDLKGKVVIIGVTASGVVNPVATPNGAKTPHQVQASILQTMINGDSVSVPFWNNIADMTALVVLGLTLIILSRVRYSLIYIAILFGAYAYLPVLLYSKYKILFDITFTIASLVVVYLHLYTAKFISEYLQKQQIKKQFGTYLSPAMVEKLQKNPELLQLGGESRELSIMFTDVRGFTTISEHYGKDVQGLTKIMNRYMTAMTARIIQNNGTLDKYIGDAQMAFWNAPLDDKDHAVNAVRTGLAMLKDLEKFNEEIAKEGIPAFGMGLGINTDTVVVGNMGSDQRFDYTCLGDGVNLASRLEGQSKPYGVKIVIGPKTAEQINEAIKWPHCLEKYQVVELDWVAVKGKKEPVSIYTVFLPEYADVMAERAQEKFLTLYRKGAWDVALLFVNDMIREKAFYGEMQSYYEMMRERIETMKKSPPKDWDGVYRATSK
jgi:adenylate cyclase